jgi:hypothetical protein
MMISSSRMELLELFLPVASNSPTKTFFVMGCKGPISHLFHKRVFQHRTNWSIAVSLQKHQHLVLGEMPQPFKTSLVLLNGFELDFVHKLLHIQCVHGPRGKENPSSLNVAEQQLLDYPQHS